MGYAILCISPLVGKLAYTRIWWRRTGSNRRPSACKAVALPTELHPHVIQNPLFFTMSKILFAEWILKLLAPQRGIEPRTP